jgi:hypothetical protein
MTDTIDLIRDHADDKHPLLDVEGCPVCEWMLKQREQIAKTPA